MGVSKIVREIEGIVVGRVDWVMGKLGERVGLSGVRVGKLGCFWKMNGNG